MNGWIGADSDAIVEPYMQEGFRAKPPRRRRKSRQLAGGVHPSASYTTHTERSTAYDAMGIATEGALMEIDVQSGTKRAPVFEDHDMSMQRMSSRQRLDVSSHLQPPMQHAAQAQLYGQQHMLALQAPCALDLHDAQ